MQVLVRATLLTTILLSAPAKGAVLDGIGLPPIEFGWDLANDLPRGQVAGIVERARMGGPVEQIPTEISANYRFTYDASGHLRGVQQFGELDQPPRSTMLYDPAGHCISSVLNTSNGRGKSGLLKTSATYDALGKLTRYTVTDLDGKTTLAPVTVTRQADSTIYSWPAQWAGKNSVTCSATYDAGNRLISTLVTLSGAPLLVTLTYNANGDVATTSEVRGRPLEKYRYEYAYDAHANWTRRAVFRTVYRQAAQEETLWKLATREITYGNVKKPADVSPTKTPLTASPDEAAAKTVIPPETPPTVSPSSPADTVRPPATQPTPELDTRRIAFLPANGVRLAADQVAGTFVSAMGDPTDATAFWSVETLTMRIDGSFAMTNKMPRIDLRGQTMTVPSTGHWHLNDTEIELDVETVNDKPASDDVKANPITMQVQGRNRLQPSDGSIFLRK